MGGGGLELVGVLQSICHEFLHRYIYVYQSLFDTILANSEVRSVL